MIDQLEGAAANHLNFQSDLVEVESCGNMPRDFLVAVVTPQSQMILRAEGA